MTEYLIISKDELSIRKNEITMNTNEVQELLTYQDVFKKYLQKKVNEIQAQLGNCKLQGKEANAYIAIETIK